MGQCYRNIPVRLSLVLEPICFFLSLDDDLHPFYALAQQDPTFEPIMQELYGYHQVKFCHLLRMRCGQFCRSAT